MDKEILKIANTLVLYSYCIENKGLIHGKMGIVLFLYHYARYFKESLYNEFADTLFDEIMEDIIKTSNDFEYGLIGIGWAIDYLIKKGFVEGNPDELLEDVDTRIFSHIHINPQYSIFGCGLYLLMRLKSDPPNKDYLTKQFDKITLLWQEKLKKNEFVIPLYHLNSVLIFVIQAYEMGYIKNQYLQLKSILEDLFEHSLSNDYFDYADLKITDEILNNNKNEWLRLSNLIEKYPCDGKEPSVESFIKHTWLNMLFFEKTILPLPSLNLISEFIDNKQTSLTINDFIFNYGLAGLGFGLIVNQQ
jgi:hypothetical protein